MMLVASTRVVVRVFVQMFNMGCGSHGVCIGRTSFKVESAFVRRGCLGFIGLTVLVIAAFLYLGQLSSQTGNHKRFHRRAGLSGAHLDAVMNQIVERPLTDAVAANNENVNAPFAQPAGKRTRLMRRRFDNFCANNYTALSVRFDQCEMLGFPKMAEEAAINNWNGNFQEHGFSITGLLWLTKFLPVARASNSSNSRRDNSPTNW